jgi:Ca2+-binding EF-hand superfamily protein
MSRLMSRLLTASAVLGALSLPALVGAFTGPASAQTESKSEALSKALQGLVDVLDMNKDGVVDREEIQAAKGERPDPANEAADAEGGEAAKPRGRDIDGDGFVTKEEFLARAERRFARMDTDGNGKLDDAEREAGRRQWGHGHRQRNWGGEGWRRDGGWREHDDGSRDGERAGNDDDRGSRRADRMFDRFDTNGDGVITRQEVEAAGGRWHDRHGKDRG